jgi:hypothetical protein
MSLLKLNENKRKQIGKSVLNYDFKRLSLYKWIKRCSQAFTESVLISEMKNETFKFYIEKESQWTKMFMCLFYVIF